LFQDAPKKLDDQDDDYAVYSEVPFLFCDEPTGVNAEPHTIFTAKDRRSVHLRHDRCITLFGAQGSTQEFWDTQSKV